MKLRIDKLTYRYIFIHLTIKYSDQSNKEQQRSKHFVFESYGQSDSKEMGDM